MASKAILKRYLKAKTLAKASIHKLGVGYKAISNILATDPTARLILAAVLLVILVSWVATAFVKRRRNRKSQTKRQQQQKEKLADVDSAVTRTVTPFKPIPKDSIPQTKRTVSSPRNGTTTTTPFSFPSPSSESLTDASAALKTELFDLKSTVADLVKSKTQTEASLTAEIAALKAEVEELHAKVDSVETDASQTASQQTVIDSLVHGQARMDKSVATLMAWRTQVAASDTAHPSASQSEVDGIAAQVASNTSLIDSVREAQEKLSSNVQLTFNIAVKDLMQYLAEAKRAAITKGVRCSTRNRSVSPTGNVASGSGSASQLNGEMSSATQRTGACLE